MNEPARKNTYDRFSLSHLLGPLSFVIIAALVLWGLANVESGSSTQGQQLLAESLHRAAVSCYAIEGSYPPSLDYLLENYGVIVDESKYAVHYEIFAANIIPQITVVPLEYAP